MLYDENNIFAKILRKEISCDKVYEDKFSLFFNDINLFAMCNLLALRFLKSSDKSTDLFLN